jgi:hypothetical protein
MLIQNLHMQFSPRFDIDRRDITCVCLVRCNSAIHVERRLGI